MLPQIAALPILALLMVAAYSHASPPALGRSSPTAISAPTEAHAPNPPHAATPDATPSDPTLQGGVPGSQPTPTPSDPALQGGVLGSQPTPTLLDPALQSGVPNSQPTPTPSDPALQGGVPNSQPTPTPSDPTAKGQVIDSPPAPTPSPTAPNPTPDGIQRVAHVPILMYHHIDVPPPGADDIRRDLSVPPSAFEEQLRFLREEGYTSITLHDLALYLTTGKPLPEKPIILTFDDGYSDAYAHAFPLLRRYGFSGTFFLVTAPIDQNNPDFLSWDQVKLMHAAGMQFEPHSYDHPDMRGRSFQFLVFEILASKEAVEARTGEPCRFFAYPSGHYDSFVIDVLRSASFWGAVLTEQGATHTTDGLFTLRRVRVHGAEDLGTFVRNLKLDW